AKSQSAIDFEALAKLGGTQVMVMGVERIEPIAAEMMKRGVRPDLPVALVRWATTGRQETLVGKLDDIAQRVRDAEFEAPAVAVFGEVVRLRDELNWYEKRPLSGKRIVVTRTRKQAGVLSQKLRELSRCDRVADDPDRASDRSARVRGARSGRSRIRLDCVYQRQRGGSL